MTEPINYTSAFDNLESPVKAFTQGLQSGAMVEELQAKQQQQQIAQQQAQQMRLDLGALAMKANPTGQDYAGVMTKYPQLADHVKKSWDVLNSAQQQNKLTQASQVYSALQAGQPQIAAKLAREQAEASRNGGNEQDAKAAETMAQWIEAHPESAKTSTALLLSSVMGPEKFATTFQTLGQEARAEDQAPADLLKKKADARKGTAEAIVAENTIPALIQKPTEDNLNAQSTRRIAELNVQIAQANSETQRGQLILERDKLMAEQGKKGAEAGEAAQAQVDSAQHAIDTIASLRADPLMKDSTGNYFAGMGTVLGKLLGVVPGTENKDFRGQLESLKSQVFLPAVQQVKGMGALSNAEGEKLTAAVAALDADMSPKAFQNALGVVEKYVTKGLQKGLANKNVPVQGGGFVMSHPTYGNVNEGDINRLLKSSPGATRQQVIDFLRISGGK